MLRIAAIALLAVLVTPPPAAARAPNWHWPVHGPLLARFHTVADPFARGQHRGIDIAAAPGTPVRSACAGRVTFAGPAATAGRTVSVRCGGLTASYLHLSAIGTHRGERVATGERIGATGTTGSPSEPTPHLHFGVRRAERVYLDPLALLGDPTLGPTPAPRPRVTKPTRTPPLTGAVPRTTALRPVGRPIPETALIGTALLLLALPGWGLRVALRRLPANARPDAEPAQLAAARGPQ